MTGDGGQNQAPPRAARRVRFSEEPDKVKLIPAAPKQVRVEGKKLQKHGRTDDSDEEEGGRAAGPQRKRRCSIPSLDTISSFEDAARVASELRTARRHEAHSSAMEDLVMRGARRGGSGGDGGDGGNWDVDDIDAEESDPEESFGFNEAREPIPLEPFNMAAEREDGYFDSHGNYIENVLSGRTLNDPWLESIDEEDKSKGIARAEALRAAAAKAASASSFQLEDEILDEDDLALYRGRVASLLRPGETVLQGLRRLGGMDRKQQPKPSRQQKQRSKRNQGTEGAEVQGDAAAANLNSSSGTATPMQKERDGRASEATMPSGATSTAVVTNSSPIGRGSRQLSAGAQALPASSGRLQVPPVRPPGTGGPSTEASCSGGAQSHAGGGQEAKDNRPGRRVPAENSIDFDKLTNYADLLLGQGDFNIYHKPKEQLDREARLTIDLSSFAQHRKARAPSAASATLLEPEAGSSGSGPRLVSLHVSTTSDGSVTVAIVVPAVAVVVPVSPSSSAAEAGKDGIEADGDDDMFGDGFAVEAEAPPSRAGAGAHTAEQETAECSKPMSPSQNVAATLISSQNTGAPVKVDAAGVEVAVDPLAGFTLDAGSGYYYSTTLGYYFDPVSHLWMDASTGLWYSCADGIYTQVIG